ncbi:uncharacterized protein [Antedon mediterranea]|uniref:uncharacterized protein n=1 Tax=Antedon mediterranea TaxID=105859 RepID=UPI003AF6A344
MIMKLLSVIVIVSCLAAKGNCIDCYTCVTTDSGCNDPFDSATITSTTCSSSITSCAKTKVSANGVNSVTRICGSVGNTCAEFLGIETCYSTCSTDDCNGAGFVTSSVVVLVTSALMYLIVR